MKALNKKELVPICITLYSLVLLLLSSCNSNNEKKQITHKADYEAYLTLPKDEVLQRTKEDYSFWEKKLEKEPEQFPYLVKVAASQSKLFSKTGTIDYLIKAEKNLLKANEATGYKNPGYLKSLAHNYVSQHRFKEALSLLKKAEMIGSGMESTQKMLFDVYMELGNYTQAKRYLDKVTDPNDFDYLIRLAKWSDHRGDLDAAIKYMEKAQAIGVASNIPSIEQWIYTNLADFYGHAGKIQQSYEHYLKALEIDPNDAYAKKGIAWIVYSYEKDPDEALRILDHITEKNQTPSYYLLKAEIADYKSDSKLKEYYTKKYKKAVQDTNYGNMYNKYNVLLYADNKMESEKALEIAHIEINNRPTPESYDLLAWSQFNRGDIKEALDIMEKYVAGQTFEPHVLFHLAEVYKANGRLEKAKALKKELESSAFELGPLVAKEIQNM
ncbi:tetratricopeptide repeat protein [Gaetbulibacter aestuarii]|uniref:Tetratricopeptide repeat protein n=1 Tax=Gaetbulibacter aestuarii TaxID=1502358 RepID=A0ABW7MYB9_9FLAO